MKVKYIFFALLLWLTAPRVFAQSIPYAEEIKAFKHQDSLNMPKPGGLLFIGSSSIRKWDDLQKRFADKPVIQRGVGGSQLWQWVKYYSTDLIYPYKAKKIFIYAGENDINAGRTPETVYDDFVTLYGMLKEHSPNAEIYFLSLKQSPSRAKTYTQTLEANRLIAAYIKDKKRTHFIDMNSVLFDANGQPDTSLFQKDMLHLNSKGYDRWQKALQNFVK